MLERPQANEYGDYYEGYISKVPNGALQHLLARQLELTTALFRELPEDKGLYRYAPGKWSVKEVLGHIIDTERVMSYRMLRIARGDKTELPGFDQDLFVDNANFNEQPMESLLAEYTTVRAATLALLAGISDEAWLRQGTVNSFGLSARALGYIIAGHELHHMDVLKKNYLKD